MSRQRKKPDSTPSDGPPVGQVRAYGFRSLQGLPAPIRRGDKAIRVSVTLTEDEARRVGLYAAWHNLTPAQLLRHLACQGVPNVTLAVSATPDASPAPSSDAIRQRMVERGHDISNQVKAAAAAINQEHLEDEQGSKAA